MDNLVQGGIVSYSLKQKYSSFWSITFPRSELVYPLCLVEYNCTKFQGEYLYNE